MEKQRVQPEGRGEIKFRRGREAEKTSDRSEFSLLYILYIIHFPVFAVQFLVLPRVVLFVTESTSPPSIRRLALLLTRHRVDLVLVEKPLFHLLAFLLDRIDQPYIHSPLPLRRAQLAGSIHPTSLNRPLLPSYCFHLLPDPSSLLPCG